MPRANKTKRYRGFMIVSHTRHGNSTIVELPELGSFTRLEDAVKAIDVYLNHRKEWNE